MTQGGMMRRTLLAVSFFATILAVPAQAAPPKWSFDRASLGVTASAAVFDYGGERVESFLPDAYLTYNMTSTFTVATLAERDFTSDMTIGKAGVRFAVYRGYSGARVYAGANVVGYGDDGAAGLAKATSWDAQLQASYPAWKDKLTGQTRMWGIVGICHDSQNALTTARIGLRFQVIGGGNPEPQDF